MTGKDATRAMATWCVSPNSSAVMTMAATASIPASIGGLTRENMTESSPSASRPSSRIPIANTQPPWAMMKIANAIAGSAMSTRAPRSDRCGRSGAAMALASPEPPPPRRELLERLGERLA